jgi:hypothetical protein
VAQEAVVGTHQQEPVVHQLMAATAGIVEQQELPVLSPVAVAVAALQRLGPVETAK